MAIDLRESLSFFEDIGIFDVALPFLLVFTLVFAILDKTEIIGKNRGVNTTVSLVAALLFVRNVALVELLNRFLPNVSMFLVVILMLLLMIGIVAGPHTAWKGTTMGVAVIVSILAIIWALTTDKLAENFSLPGWVVNLDDQTKATILFIAIFVLVIFWVTKEDREGKEGFLEKLGKEIKGE